MIESHHFLWTVLEKTVCKNQLELTKPAHSFNTHLPLQRSSEMGDSLLQLRNPRAAWCDQAAFSRESWEGLLLSPSPAPPILPEERRQPRFEQVALFSTPAVYFLCVGSVCAHVRAHTGVATANTLSFLEGVYLPS